VSAATRSSGLIAGRNLYSMIKFFVLDGLLR
jgi:hypothetical protein